MGYQGGAGRYVYGVEGDAVNTASRIESLNQYLGTALAVEVAIAEQLDEILFRPLGRFQLKGRVEISELVEPKGFRNQVTEEQVRFCTQFASALQAFSQQQWQQAIQQFEQLCEQYPHDGPSRFYWLVCKEPTHVDIDSQHRAYIKMEAK